MFVQFEYGAAFQLFGHLGFYIGVSGFEVGRGFAAAGGFGDVSGQFVKRACVRALRQGLVGPFGDDAVRRVEAAGQHGLRVGEVLRVPEVDRIEGHGCAFLSVVLKVGSGGMPDLLLRFYCFLKSCQLWARRFSARRIQVSSFCRRFLTMAERSRRIWPSEVSAVRLPLAASSAPLCQISQPPCSSKTNA